MKKYKCEICGKHHTIYRSLDIPLPRMISIMSEEDRKKRVKEFDGLYYVDDELLFANGWVNIEVESYDFPFYYWKTWVSISKTKFLENFSALKAGKVIEFDGKLEEKLPFYPDSKDLKTTTLIQVGKEEIIVEIRAQEDSQLKEDQSKPITEARMIQIMQMLHHPPERSERKKFEKPFRQRFQEALKNVVKQYFQNEKNFAINISAGTVLFQIISNKLLELNSTKERGFGLHLSFDESFDESQKEITRFKSKAYSKKFDYHDLDEIPTYQIDLGMNKEQLEELVHQIIVDVYELEPETIEVDHFEI